MSSDSTDQTPPDHHISTPRSTNQVNGRIAFPSPQNPSSPSAGLIDRSKPSSRVESSIEWERDGTLCLRFPRLPGDVVVAVQVLRKGHVLTTMSVTSPFSSYQPFDPAGDSRRTSVDGNYGLRSTEGGREVLSNHYGLDTQNQAFASRTGFYGTDGSFPIDPGVHPPLGHTAVYDLPSEHWRAVPDNFFKTTPDHNPEKRDQLAQLQWAQESPTRTVNPRDAIHFSRASSPPHSTADSEADRNPGAEGTLEDIFKFDAELSDREDDGSSVSGA